MSGARWRKQPKATGFYVIYMPESPKWSEHLIYFSDGKYSYSKDSFGDREYTHDAAERLYGHYMFYGPIKFPGWSE